MEYKLWGSSLYQCNPAREYSLVRAGMCVCWWVCSDSQEKKLGVTTNPIRAVTQHSLSRNYLVIALCSLAVLDVEVTWWAEVCSVDATANRVFSSSASCIKTHAKYPKELSLTGRLRSFLRSRGSWHHLRLRVVIPKRNRRKPTDWSWGDRVSDLHHTQWTFPQVVTSLSNKLYADLAVPQIFTSTLTDLLPVNVQVSPTPQF